MIDFELEPQTVNLLDMYHAMAEHMVRPISRQYDEHEHEQPWDFWESTWAASHNLASASGEQPALSSRNLYTCLTTEELCWGDAGLFLSIPNPGLGGAAVAAAGTPEQKARFLSRFRHGTPKWAAMAITE
ncbi:MAG: acyl-CoA/acyl-ACP dehydrogenase, partial [Deltaproteobacteria bacterium]|nr:acyl-CoA/acyl-ACP dehydrogenase [Deltaproteobacteria bacterium]